MCAGLGATLLTIPLTLALPHDVKNLLKVPVGVSRVFSGGTHRSDSREMAPRRSQWLANALSTRVRTPIDDGSRAACEDLAVRSKGIQIEESGFRRNRICTLCLSELDGINRLCY
jgi:hypothetical protein